MHRDSQNTLGRILADDVLVKARDDLSRTGDLGEQLLARTTAFAFLVQDRLAELDALATDIDVARSFDQGSDISITFTTE
jgi:hypothetical protein